MVQIQEQIFSLQRSFVRLIKFGVWFFGAFSVLSIVLAVVDFIESPENQRALVVYLLIMLLFTGFAYAGFRTAQQFERAPVSLDQDGIWSTALGKTKGLIRWADVGSIKERQYGQRLELLDRDGDSLIKLEYQLEGFEELRRVVHERVQLPDLDVECPATYSKSAGYHIFTILAVTGFSAVSYYAGQLRPILGLLVLGVIAMSIYDYLKTAAKLSINRRTLSIMYPLRTRSFDISEVNSIQLGDQFVRGSRLPEVIVATHTSQKPIRLGQIGIDASELYDLLTRWKNERLFS